MIVDGVKIEFGILEDETIATDTITATGSDESWFSNINDTLDRGDKQNIAYLEDNYWLLDGSFIMPTDDDITGAGEIKNVIKDTSFENSVWTVSEAKDETYEDRWTLSSGKSSDNVRTGSVSYWLKFVNSGGVQISSNRYARAVQTIFDNSSPSLIAGHKYYIRAFVKNDRESSFEYYGGFYRITIETSPNATLNTYDKLQRKTISGEDWGYISNIVKAGSGSQKHSIMIGCCFSVWASWSVTSECNVWFDDVIAIDLTEKYGAGNEPSIEICDRIFNGQKSIIVGYEGETINQTQTLTYTFAKKHDSYGITLKFPPTCIPQYFSVDYYDGNTQIGLAHFETNYKSDFYTNEDTRLQWNKVIITLSPSYGTSETANKRARLQYVIFGVNDEYKEDELIEVTANRTISPTAEYADSGEISFSFFNDGRYAIQTIKELSQNVIDRLKMSVYVRKQFETEYTPFGVYYAESGKVEERGHVITLTGHDGIFKLDDVMFTSGKVYQEGRSLADWAREVANTAGVQIDISAAFESIMSTGYIAEVPCREAFRLIAEAGHGIFGVDENDVMHLWGYDDIITDSFEITDDNIVDGSFSLENQNKYLGISVSQYTFTRRSEEEEIGKIENLLVNQEIQTIEVDFSSSPVDPDTIRIDATGGTPTIIEKTNSRIKFTMYRSAEMTVTIQIYGVAYDVISTTIERGETKKDVKEISDNFLITSGMGDAVADYQYEHAANKYNYTVDTMTEEELRLGEVRDMQGQSVVITDVGFSIAYGEHEESIKGVDK